MKPTALILSIFLFALSLQASPRLVARIDDPASSTLQRFLSEGADIASYKPSSWLDLVLTEEQFSLLRSEFPGLRVTQTEAQLKTNLQAAKDIPGYRSYTQMLDELLQLQAQYPSLMQVSSLGESWGSIYAGQGIPYYQTFDHELWAVKVSANVQLQEDEPAFYFLGEHHAREPLSTEACMGILIHLLENYGSEPVVTGILDTSEVWIVPLLNPDGHKLVIDQTDVWWRKNIRDNNASQTYGSNSDGVDLNRNYGYEWGYTSASDDNGSETYHGPDPFSEPETQAFRDLLLSRRFLAGISYHTYGEYVLYPYGYVSGIYAPDTDELAALAFEVAACLPAVAGGGNYAPGPSWGLYPVSGSLDDWAYATNSTFAYTIEMAQQFIPSATLVAQIVPQQVAGAMQLLNRKNYKTLQGHVTDAVTGQPLAATIHIEGLDDGPIYRAPVKSDSLTGSYYRFLPAGSFHARAFKDGYASQYIEMNVSAVSVTVADFQLTPGEPFDLGITVQNDFFEPLEGATMIVGEDSIASYSSDANGQILIPGFLPGFYRLRVSKPGFETLDLSRDVLGGNITLRITSYPVLLEDFEENMNAWTSTGTWNRSGAVYHSGAFSLCDSPAGNYQNNASSNCRLNLPLDLHNLQNANLQFWLRTDLELDGDCLSLEASLDGANWQILDYYTGTGDWQLKTCNLNSFIGSSLYLRFRLFSTNWNNADGVWIDDFQLFANADATQANDFAPATPELRLQAWPNPFTQSCRFSLKTKSAAAGVCVAVYNLRGQMVRELGRKNLTKGSHEFSWDGQDQHGRGAANGVYLVKVSNQGGTLLSKKILRLK